MGVCGKKKFNSFVPVLLAVGSDHCALAKRREVEDAALVQCIARATVLHSATPVVKASRWTFRVIFAPGTVAGPAMNIQDKVSLNGAMNESVSPWRSLSWEFRLRQWGSHRRTSSRPQCSTRAFIVNLDSATLYNRIHAYIHKVITHVPLGLQRMILLCTFNNPFFSLTFASHITALFKIYTRPIFICRKAGSIMLHLNNDESNENSREVNRWALSEDSLCSLYSSYFTGSRALLSYTNETAWNCVNRLKSFAPGLARILRGRVTLAGYAGVREVYVMSGVILVSNRCCTIIDIEHSAAAERKRQTEKKRERGRERERERGGGGGGGRGVSLPAVGLYIVVETTIAGCCVYGCCSISGNFTIPKSPTYQFHIAVYWYCTTER